MGTINRTTAQINQDLLPVHIHLKQTTSETITGDGTPQSPGTNISVVPDPAPENCSYTDGSINYDGALNVTRYLYANISVEAITGGTTIILQAGKNGTPDADFAPEINLKSSGDTALLELEVPISVTGNSSDTVDFFVTADNNFTLNNAIFRFGEKSEGAS